MKLAYLTALIGICFGLFAPHPGEAADKYASAFDRVVNTGVLRCAYSPYDPMVIIDPNTKQMSGIFYDLVNEAGKRAGIEVQWVEEVGFGNINAGFLTGRYDAFCAGLWPSGNRARNTVFSKALFFDPISVFVRADDNRFDGALEKLDSADVKLAITEGDATATMARAMFPQAVPFYTTEFQTIADEINNVVSGKADATFRDLISAALYLKNNPGTIKDASPGQPALMYPLTVGFNKGEYGLKTLFDTVITELQNDGTVEKTVQKYMKGEAGLFFRADVEYEPFSE